MQKGREAFTVATETGLTMDAKQHFRGMQYLHRTLAIGTVTGLVSVYARLLAAGPPNDLHKFSGLSLYCSLLCTIRIKFYLDDEDHFQRRVDAAQCGQELEFGDLVDAFCSCLSWVAFLAAVALLQYATLSRDAILVAMFSSIIWIIAAMCRDKQGTRLRFHSTIGIANLIYGGLFIWMNFANPSWFGEHAPCLGRYLEQETPTLLAFLVCICDWVLTYRYKGNPN